MIIGVVGGIEIVRVGDGDDDGFICFRMNFLFLIIVIDI
jgi:hypothetical protein